MRRPVGVGIGQATLVRKRTLGDPNPLIWSFGAVKAEHKAPTINGGHRGILGADILGVGLPVSETAIVAEPVEHDVESQHHTLGWQKAHHGFCPAFDTSPALCQLLAVGGRLGAINLALERDRASDLVKSFWEPDHCVLRLSRDSSAERVLNSAERVLDQDCELVALEESVQGL